MIKIKAYIHEFWRYRDLRRLLVEKNVKLKYRRSFLGYLWSILNPLLIMLVMTVVFSKMFSRNIDNYPVYLFCGQLLFNFMRNSTDRAISSISISGAMLKKCYLPKYIFTLATIDGSLIDLIFSMGALLVVMIATGARFTLWLLLIPVTLAQLYVFCLGLGLFLAQANVFFRDMHFIYNAVTTAWLYLTPIFYPIESLSEKISWLIRHFNPMYFYIEQFRSMVYKGTAPSLVLIAAGTGAAVLMLLVGILSFYKTKDRFILYI
ncbi:MAG: ABC transporter permease [Clostridia bacterium]|nr:ABC transporter permease [Clostridia bacterium]